MSRAAAIAALVLACQRPVTRDPGVTPVDARAQTDARPPVAPREDTVVTLHGRTLPDPYAWLRRRDDPRTRRYLEQETAYTEAWLHRIEDLRARVRDELRARVIEDDLSVPVEHGGWAYFDRIARGQQYPVYLRRATVGGAEQTVLDCNARAAGHEHFSLGAMTVSPDHSRVAWSEDVSGAERYRVLVAQLPSGAVVAQLDGEPGYAPSDDGDHAGAIGESLAWAGDSRTLFFTTLDQAHREWRLWRVDTRTRAPATLVFEESDPQHSVSVHRSRDDRTMVMSSNSQITSEVRLLPADTPAGAWQVVEPRRTGLEYEVEPRGEELLVLTNDGAPEFMLARASMALPGRAHWRPGLRPPAGGSFSRVEAFAEHVVLAGRSEGLPQVWIADAAARLQAIAWPDAAYSAYLGDTPQFTATRLRLHYSSPVVPDSVYDYDLGEHRLELRDRDEVPRFDPSRYRVSRLHAPADDGAQIPITLVRPVAAQGLVPVLLHGYGAYGASYDADFDADALPLLDRGVAVAIAHVRGGGELGRAWYHAGKLAYKQRSFDDFIRAAEFLVESGVAAPGRIAIEGGSAGGLLVGAAVTQRPELFRAALVGVPFVDVINTMRDASLPLTAGEWDEWGDPRRAADFATMVRYSPYDNVRAQRYPDMLVLAGWNDPRVGYWEPAKWVARLRAEAESGSLLLLRTDMGSGHSGASGRYDALDEQAVATAFVLDRLGLDR
ncbi:MAG: S9 family peptidase [Nannocystaceae bacterium]